MARAKKSSSSPRRSPAKRGRPRKSSPRRSPVKRRRSSPRKSPVRRRKSGSPRVKRAPSAYNKFMSAEIKRLQVSHPNISHRERFRKAAHEWTRTHKK